MEPLKEMFNKAYFQELAKNLKHLVPDLNEREFMRLALLDLGSMELNERLRHTSRILNICIPGTFQKKLDVLYLLATKMPKGYTALVYPDFVAQFGLTFPQLSLPALKYFTAFGSSEFAIRHFLKADFKRTIKTMVTWSKDNDFHVRRLASEGSRPRLPWSFKLEEVLKDPAATAIILDNLKRDPELYVRKSVANHLNDLSKDNSEYMLETIARWDLSNAHTAWIVKHASRTLIKKGDLCALRILKYDLAPEVSVKNFRVTPEIKLGENMAFSFSLKSDADARQRLVVDYRIHYVKGTGKITPKVFKLKTVELDAREQMKIEKRQVVKDFSTRKHFSGKHLVELLVNGKVMAKASFLLTV